MSAIAGAIVGGLIALLAQLIALRATKKQRDEDRDYIRKALGNSLLFKMIRVHSNFFNIHHHVEVCYKEGIRRGDISHPWRFFIPLANPPDPIAFSSDEMGMLISLRDNDVFNSMIDMDVAHNSLLAVLRVAIVLRKELTEKLKVDGVDGSQLAGVLRPEEWLALQPRMIEVNSVIEQMRAQAKKEYEASKKTLDDLATLFRVKLGLGYSIEPVPGISI